MAYLQLVLAGLSLRGWVQEIDSENLFVSSQPLHLHPCSSCRISSAVRRRRLLSGGHDCMCGDRSCASPCSKRHRHSGEVRRTILAVLVYYSMFDGFFEFALMALVCLVDDLCASSCNVMLPAKSGVGDRICERWACLPLDRAQSSMSWHSHTSTSSSTFSTHLAYKRSNRTPKDALQ